MARRHRAARTRRAGTPRRTGALCATSTPPARNSSTDGSTCGQPRRPGDQRRGDPGEGDDLRRDAGAGVDERRELADPLAAAHLDRPDLGDRVALGGAAGGLEVEHDEVTSRSGVPSSSKDSWGAGAGGGAGTVADASREPRQFRGRAAHVACPRRTVAACPDRPGGPAPQRRTTGATRLTWTDVRDVRRPAPALRGRSGPPGRVAGVGGRRRAGARSLRGAACPSRCGRGWPRPRPSRSVHCPSTTSRSRCAASPASRPPSAPGSAAPRCSRSWSRPAAFRAAVVAWWDEHRPGELAPSVGRPLAAAAAAVLVGGPGAPPEAVALAARRGEAVELRAERDEALARVDKLTGELERLRAELADARAAARSAGQERDAEYQQLRRRVSEQGARLRAALDGRAAAEQAVEELRADGGGGPGRAAPPSATGSASGPRPSGAGRPTPSPRSRRPGRPPGRRASPTRSASGCCSTPSAARSPGLRRELALGGGGPRPGRSRGGRPVGARRRAPSTRWRRSTRCCRCRRCTSSSTATTSRRPAIPSCRWPTSARGSRASSRRSPRGPAWRSRSSSTARAWWRRPRAAPAGVRVLFSDPGVLADDVIRALVAAEPQGRPVVVATSDKAVVTSVCAHGRAQRAVARCCCSGSRAADGGIRAGDRARNCRCPPLASRPTGSTRFERDGGRTW